MKFKKFLVSACLTFFVSSSLAAGPDCRALLSQNESVLHKSIISNTASRFNTKIHFTDDSPQRLRPTFLGLIDRINKMFESASPKQLQVKLDEKVNWLHSSYDKTENTVSIGNSGDLNTVSTVHELFHGSFNTKVLIQFEGKRIPFIEIIKIMNERYTIAAQKSDGDELSIYIKFKDMESILKPYDELFADLATVIFHNDGSIFKKSFSEFPEHLDANGNTASGPRDFQQLVNFKKFKSTYDPVYSSLDPARGAIWKYLQTKLQPNTSSDTILNAFLSAAEEHINLRLSQLETGRTKPSLNRNQEFIRLFYEHGNRLKLWK